MFKRPRGRLWGYRHHRYIFEEREQRKAGEKVKKQRVIARLQVPLPVAFSRFIGCSSRSALRGRFTLRCVLQPRCCGSAVAVLTSVIGSAAATCRADLIKRTQRLHEESQSCLVPGSHLRGSHGDGGHCGVEAIVTAGAVARR